MKWTRFLILLLAACGDDGGGVGGGACLDAATLAILDSHIEKLRFSAAMLAGHPGEREATGFFLFPELPVERAAVYAGPLVEVCSTPLTYEEFCEEDGLCSQIECTGQGAGWIMHFRLNQAVGDYTSATVDVSWLDGATGVTYETAATAGAWSVTGDGAMDTTASMGHAIHPSLVADGPVEVTVSDTSEGVHMGSVTIGEVEAATVDGDGRLVPVGGCAP